MAPPLTGSDLICLAIASESVRRAVSRNFDLRYNGLVARVFAVLSLRFMQAHCLME